MTLFEGDPDALLPPCAITLLLLPSPANEAILPDDVEAPEFISNTAKAFGGRLNGCAAESAATHSNREVLLFLASTSALTDSMAAATLRGVTII